MLERENGVSAKPSDYNPEVIKWETQHKRWDWVPKGLLRPKETNHLMRHEETCILKLSLQQHSTHLPAKCKVPSSIPSTKRGVRWWWEETGKEGRGGEGPLNLNFNLQKLISLLRSPAMNAFLSTRWCWQMQVATCARGTLWPPHKHCIPNKDPTQPACLLQKPNPPCPSCSTTGVAHLSISPNPHATPSKL